MSTKLNVDKKAPLWLQNLTGALGILMGAKPIIIQGLPILDEATKTQAGQWFDWFGSMALLLVSIAMIFTKSNSEASLKKKGYIAPLLLMLFASYAFSSCSTTKQAQVSSDIQRYTQSAIEITAKIQKAVDDPRLEAVTIFTPAEWDNSLRVQVRGFIASALPYIGIAHNCKDAELEILFHCLVVELRYIPEEQHRQLLNKLSALIALGQQFKNVKP